VLNYYQSKADVNETIRLVREAGSQAVAVKGDIAISSTSHQLVTTAYETFGRLDAVVNNAGIHRYKYLAEVKEEDWEAQLAVNLKGPFLLSQRAVDEWRLHKNPRANREYITGQHLSVDGGWGINPCMGGFTLEENCPAKAAGV
jgi:NAD(P)-dependent dehydrogenase (short-subunit alcohol dehydrogenase family)